MSTEVSPTNTTPVQGSAHVHLAWRDVILFVVLAYGLGVERLLAPSVPGRLAYPIYDAHRTVRTARRRGDPAGHARPDDRRPRHAHLRRQGRGERLSWPPALPEILPGGARCAGGLRHGGGPYRAGAGLGRVQLVGGQLVRLSHALAHRAAGHPVHLRGRVRLAGLPPAAASAAR